MLQSAKNLVKFVEKVKPNEDAIISMGIRNDGEIDAFFYLHKGNGREIFAKLIHCATLQLVQRDTDKYIDLEGMYEGYKLRVTFLNERDQVWVDPKEGYPEAVKNCEYWNYLTAEEWKSFMKEFYSINKYVGQEGTGAFQKYLKEKADKGFRSIIMGAFIFANTSEENVWYEICDRTQPIV
jgi:hypothetical protein